jgi:hypothetical protein
MGSAGGWGNPVVGGTALRIPAIESPNFSMVNQTGWAIFANGTAYFFNVVVAGTITGSTLVIDGPAGGVFVYSGAPAAGNLIGSWAGASGSDAFGNVYPQGFSSSLGAISGSTFSGPDFIINSSGLFIYSGTPAGPSGGTLTETAVTPQIVTPVAGVATSTNTFSPPAGSMVVVPVSWLFASNIGATVTCKDSLGNTYTAGPQVQDVNDVGISALFTHVYATAPGAITVKVTCTNAGGAHAILAPRIITGQAASQAGAATVSAAGGPSSNVQESITTTVKGSLVYIAAEAASVATLTAVSSTTTILADADALVGDTGGTGRTGATVTPGATTIGWTSTMSTSFGFAALEILPAGGTGNLIGSWTGASGTDAFGNPYPQGLSVSIGTISGSTFEGSDFIINSNGIWMYSGAPAAGDLIMALVNPGGTGIDPFGNTSPFGLSMQYPVYVGPFSGTPASVSNVAVLFSQLGSLQVVDGLDGVRYGTERHSQIMPAGGFNVTATGLTDTGLHMPVGARPYRISGMLLIQAPAAAPGTIELNFAGPGGATGTIAYSMMRAAVLNGTAVQAPNTTFTIGPSPLAVNNEYIIYMDGAVTFTTTGTAALEAGVAAGATSFVVAANSYIDFLPAN